ncbi:non-ribosomal peptide synthetase [Kineosporia babensis]|uniref:Amino acid adenylation domain-containing protein n=1 Tax=Kineosporia babensis TaxID=499548 RepID=A0A9X1NCK4_9ACTN|nr:amino acid adenylation domain-containing protein [Kineosporia babensis]
MTFAVRALQEVARRLDRNLVVGSTSIETLDRPPAAAFVLHTSTFAAGVAGPVVHAQMDDCGGVAVDLTVADDDLWAPAAAAVTEMCTELLSALLADPEVDLTTVPALSKATESQVLGPLAGLAVDHGPLASVPERLLTSARTTPDAVAVYAADGTLTYRQLVSRASALATRLQVEPGSLVPVLVAEGLALPIAWTAVMFAGAGYVPLDPRWPTQRIERVLDLLGAAPVVCADPAAVPQTHRAVVIDQAEISPAAVPVGPDDIVYGVFTSGTTGTPMCAVNQHRGVANRLKFMSRWFGPPPQREVVLQNTRHTFDSAFWQIFWPLTTGGATVIPSVGEHLDLQHTIDLIEAHGVSVTDFVPGVLNALLSLLEQRPALVGQLRSLRHLVVGGEQINPHDVHRMQQLLPGLRVSNGYGPTEAAIGMIFHEVSAADGDDVPLGRPIDNCAAVIVDVDGKPLPPGATGEIVIGGACIGLGYHGAPQRSAQRFFECPWPTAGPVLTGRMYRTGDLGHLDAQGRFHFAGRIDHQIKVGGVRIEPGEVEAAALAFPGVRQAVALVVGPATGRELVLITTGPATSREVLDHLRTRLPRHSVPQRCVVVEEMPLTEAGKTDRRQLALRAELAGQSTETTDPVLDVLRSSLRRPDLNSSDDVFAAGVNSLQAVAAVVALTERFKVELGVKDLLEHPTAARLRELVARREREHGAVPDVAALVSADLALVPSPGPQRSARRPVKTVLLTGATGFVGARLLFELLEEPDLNVVCLVRGQDDGQAQRRLRTAMTAQGLDHPGLADRTRVVAGDLGRSGLGLSADRWLSLVAGCDLVLHNGAMVNFLYDYRMHREPNVLGTAEVIRFAREAGGIPVHYISSLGVLHDHAVRSPGRLPEDVDPAEITPPSSGYSLSKWVAERLLQSASDLPVTVLRLGEIMPAAGAVQQNSSAVTHLLLSAFERLGAVPMAQLRSDFTPVDEAARVVVRSVREQAVWGRALHVFRPGTVLFDEIPAGAARISCTAFIERLRETEELSTLLAIIEHRAAGALDEEASARATLENLLQDNPLHFDRSVSAGFEERAAEPALNR